MKHWLLIGCLALAGCLSTTRDRPVTLSADKLEGTFSAMLMVTWAHSFTFKRDGAVHYEITYDQWEESDNGDFVTGQYSDGTWKILDGLFVEILLPARDGTTTVLRLQGMTRSGRFGLQVVPPFDRGFPDTTFWKDEEEEPNKTVEDNSVGAPRNPGGPL